MTQTGPDLVSAGFPTSNIWIAALGASGSNVAQPNLPVRTNLEWFGLSAAVATTNVLVGGASGASAIVPIPVTPGHLVSRVGVFVTNTAASVPTHSWAALYQGVTASPALIAQTTDAGSAAIAANAPYSWSFSSPVSITATQAPFGFVYAMVSVTATTLPTAVTVTGPTIGAWGTMVVPSLAPLGYSIAYGSALSATAPATFTGGTNTTATLAVVLT